MWNSLQPCTSRHGHTTWSFTKDGTLSSFYTTSAAGINAKVVSIRWQSSDLSPKTTSATTTASTEATATSTVASASQTSTTSAGGGGGVGGGSSGSGGLSSGAKAGVGIGAAVGCIFLILLGIWGIRWQKRRKEHAELAQNQKYGELEGHSAAHELGQTGISGFGPRKSSVIHSVETDEAQRPHVELEARELE